jgi:mannose-6-phosphate isomerase class I
MKHVKFEATHPNILPASQNSEQSFDAPVEEFHLKKYQPSTSLNLPVNTATIVFATEGSGKFQNGDNAVEIKRGEALLLLPEGDFLIEPSATPFTFFSVSTPLDKN